MQYSKLGEENGEGVIALNGSSPHSPETRRRTSNGVSELLKEPLTDVEVEDDPFYVFREDLYRKLDLVEDSLTEYLRVVHQTVRGFV